MKDEGWKMKSVYDADTVVPALQYDTSMREYLIWK